MPAQTGLFCFDGLAEPKWEVPVAMIGGLPIAVIDRARSAALMVALALAAAGSGRVALWRRFATSEAASSAI